MSYNNRRNRRILDDQRTSGNEAPEERTVNPVIDWQVAWWRGWVLSFLWSRSIRHQRDPAAWSQRHCSWTGGKNRSTMIVSSFILALMLHHPLLSAKSFQFNCSHTPLLQQAMNETTSVARGETKAAFKIQLQSRPYILKSNDFLDQHAIANVIGKGSFDRSKQLSKQLKPLTSHSLTYLRELDKLLNYKTVGLPEVHGYCTSQHSTWILLEDAVDSMRALSKSKVDVHGTNKMAASILCLFATFPELGIGVDAASHQFAFTRDWRLNLVDLDVLIQKSQFVNLVQRKVKSLKCDSDADCQKSIESRFSQTMYKLCISPTCSNNKCIYDGKFFMQDTICMLAHVVYRPLIRFGLKKQIVETCTGDVNSRPTYSELKRWLTKRLPAEQQNQVCKKSFT